MFNYNNIRDAVYFSIKKFENRWTMYRSPIEKFGNRWTKTSRASEERVSSLFHTLSD